MPRVRLPTPSVSTTALPTPGAIRRDTSGAEAIARAAGQVTEAADRVAAVREKERKEALAIRLEELEGEFTGTVNDGLTNSEHGLLNQQGTNATAASVPMYEALEKRRTELLEKVEDPEAKRILNVRLQRLIDSARARGEAHVAGEIQRVDDNSFSILKAGVKDRLGSVALDPTARAEAIEQLVPQLRAYAARKGMKPEDVAGLEAQWRGEAAEIVMNRLISAGQYGQARSYLADPAVRNVLGDRLPRFEASLTQDERDAAGAARARGFVQAATNSEGRFDLATAQTQLDQLLASDATSEEKKAAEQEFAAAARRAEGAWRAKLGAARDSALTKIENAGGSLAAAREEKRWLLRRDVNGGEVWRDIERSVEADRRARGESGAEARRAQRALDNEAVSSFDAIVSLKDRVELNVDAEYPDASKEARAKIRAKQARAKHAWEKGLDVDFTEFGARVGVVLKGLEKEDQPKFVEAMNAWYFAWIDDPKHANQRPPASEVTDEIARQLETVNVSWGRDKPRYRQDDPNAEPLPAGEQSDPRARARRERLEAKPSSETVEVLYGGKRLRIPRSDLEAAKADGAEEVK